MKKALNRLLLALLILCSKPVLSQIDTVFWFAAPWVSAGHASNVPVVLRLSSFGNATQVRVRQPASTFDTTFTIPANSLVSESLSHIINQIENSPANTTLNKGLKITSNFPITVVYEIVSTGNNPETYSLKGQNGMGLEFVCPFQTNGDNGNYTPAPKSQIDIVATENNTVIWITPKCNVVGHTANVTYSISLNAGQSYGIENTTRITTNAGRNLSGTIIVSNKPISVSVTDDSVGGVSGCFDIMGDQIVPVEVVGTEYIINKGGLSGTEFEGAYIVATENFTQITINDGAITTKLLNKGDTYYYKTAQPLTYIVGDKPFYVIHASGFGCELGEAIIPPLNCAGSDQVSFTRTNTQEFILNILCKTTATGNFVLNGSTTLVPASGFTVVPGTGGLWSGFKKSFTTTEIPVGITNLLSNSNATNSLFSMGVINGGSSTGCLYHYMSSFLRKVYTNAGVDKNLCTNTSTISLNGSVEGGATTGVWTTSNGTGTFGNTTSLNTTYTLSTNDLNQSQLKFVLSSTGNCTPIRDTLLVNVYKSPIVDAGSGTTLCKNNISTIPLVGSLQLAAGANWSSSGTGSFGSTGALSTTYLPSPNDLLKDSLTLKLTSTGSLNGCANTSDSLKIYFTKAPVVTVGTNTSVCANNPTIAITGSVTIGSTTGVWSGGLGSFSSNTSVLTNTYTANSTDIAAGFVKLILSSSNNGLCKTVKDSITINFTSSPSVNAGVDLSSCKNNAATVLSATVSGATSTGIWSGGTGTFTPNNSGLNAIYTPNATELTAGFVKLILTSSNNGTCNQVKDSVLINFTSSPSVNAGVDLSSCKNNSGTVLTATVSGATTTGVWSGGSGTYNPSSSVLNATYTPSSSELSAGFVNLSLASTNNGNCLQVTDNVRIDFTGAPVVAIGPDISVCSNNADVVVNGSVTIGASTGIWSGGLGTFNPGNSVLSATYTPSSTEIAAGFTYLKLTSTNNGKCKSENDSILVSFTSSPIVQAGDDLLACENNASTVLSATVSGATSTGIWSGGTGTFTPNNSGLNAIYTPNATELTAGFVKLILTSSNNGTCNQVKDSVLINFTSSPSVNAGVDLSSCKNNSGTVLTATVSGATTTGVWSGGSGTYNPSSSVLNATYTPSSSELSAGFVNLSLASTNNGNCLQVTDNVRIDFTGAPVVAIGPDISVCSNNAEVVVNGSVTVGATTGIWSGGSGTFNPGNSVLSATYTPSSTEIAAGFTYLKLTSTNNGKCKSENDSILVSFTSSPIVQAGDDLLACENNASTVLSATVSGATSTGIWSGGTGTFTPNNSGLNAIYTPNATELTAGFVNLILTSSNNGTCNQVKDSVLINFTSAPSANAGSDLIACENNAVSILSGVISGATTTGVWSGGSGTYNPSSSVLNATYTPSSSELSAGFVNLSLASTNNGNCLQVTDNVRIDFTGAPVVAIGPDISVCSNNAEVVVNGSVTVGATTGIWSGGSGTFNPGNSVLSATYTPSSTEIATGFTYLKLTSTNNGKCKSENDSILVSFTSSPIVNAGDDLLACENNASTVLSATVSGATSTGIWSGGLGTYNPSNTNLSSVYIPDASEIAAGFVKLILTSSNNGNCNQVLDSVLINFTSSPIVDAGSNLVVCENNSMSVLTGVVSGNTTTGVWSGGSGTYNPSSSVLNATYTPSSSELSAGFVNLSLASTNNGNCLQVTDNVRIDFTGAPVVAIGPDISVCSNNAEVVVNGSVTVGATTGVWSGGSGTFNPGNSVLSATYTPSSTEIAIGHTYIKLTSTNNGNCKSENDSILVSFTSSPIVNAGDDLLACENNASTVLSATVSGATSTGIWSGGTGTFTPNNNGLNAIYTPDASEIAAGFVKLILTSSNNGTCNQVQDSVLINFTSAPSANAGVDLSVCKNNSGTVLTGTVSGVTTTGVWSGGSGTYNPSSSVLNATYTPSSSELSAGFVKLSLASTNNETCNQVLDSVLISYTESPSVSVGSDVSVCENNPLVTLSGSVSLGSSSGVWSTNGSGIFTTSSTSLTTEYQLSLADIANGNVLIKLTSTNNGNCKQEQDSLNINVNPKPNVFAGVNDTICSNSMFYPINGNITGGFASGVWSSSSNGVFGDANNLNTTYTLNQADTIAGKVDLILTSTGNNCLPERDTIFIIIAKSPLVNSGFDQLICDNERVVLNGSVSGLTNLGAWVTLGTGDFTPDDSVLTTYYHPSVLDIANGSVKIVLGSINNKGCNAVTDTINITFKTAPIANFNTNNVCYKSAANFTDLSSTSTGTNVSWNWNFGDGSSTESSSNAIHTYTNPGTYSVSFVAENTNGCKDTMVKNIEIYFLPQTQFYQNSPCVGNTTQFADSTKNLSGTITNWNWNFGDGQFSNIQNPQHAYSSATSNIVKLVTTSSFGCKDSIQKVVTVVTGPTALFSINPNPVEALMPTSFTDLSYGPSAIANWYWTFGDASVSNLQNVDHIYGNQGNYSVLLVVKDINGCVDTTRQELSVILLPDVPTAFTPNGDGNNDVFFVRGGPFKTTNLRVYNNWGQLIFESNDQLIGWDGTFNGTDQPLGVYVWVVEVEMLNGKKVKKTGDVTLLR